MAFILLQFEIHLTIILLLCAQQQQLVPSAAEHQAATEVSRRFGRFLNGFGQDQDDAVLELSCSIKQKQ